LTQQASPVLHCSHPTHMLVTLPHASPPCVCLRLHAFPLAPVHMGRLSSSIIYHGLQRKAAVACLVYLTSTSTCTITLHNTSHVRARGGLLLAYGNTD